MVFAGSHVIFVTFSSFLSILLAVCVKNLLRWFEIITEMVTVLFCIARLENWYLLVGLTFTIVLMTLQIFFVSFFIFLEMFAASKL